MIKSRLNRILQPLVLCRVFIFLLSLALLFLPERLREHQQDHVGGEPTGRGRPLRLRADQADLHSAGPGLEELRRRAGRALHHPRHVVRLPPEGRTGEGGRITFCDQSSRFKRVDSDPPSYRLLSTLP